MTEWEKPAKKVNFFLLFKSLRKVSKLMMSNTVLLSIKKANEKKSP